MRRSRTIIALLAASAALLGVLAYVIQDDGGGAAPTGKAAPAGARKPVATLPPDGWTTGDAGPALDPAQQALVKAALERLGSETAIRTAFTAGVAEPWPLPAAQSHFEACVTTVRRGLPVGRNDDPGAICACATRAIQGVYPREPPQPTSAKARRIVGENFRTAVDECLNP